MKDEKIQEALNVLRADYYETVRSVAKEILAECKRDESLDMHDQIHESIDGNHFVIYTYAAIQCLQASDNWLASEDEGIEVDNSDFSKSVSQRAYFAMCADVSQQIEAERSNDDEEAAE